MIQLSRSLLASAAVDIKKSRYIETMSASLRSSTGLRDSTMSSGADDLSQAKDTITRWICFKLDKSGSLVINNCVEVILNTISHRSSPQYNATQYKAMSTGVLLSELLAILYIADAHSLLNRPLSIAPSTTMNHIRVTESQTVPVAHFFLLHCHRKVQTLTLIRYYFLF